MDDGFDTLDPEIKAKLKDAIGFCSDTGASKVSLKNEVQTMFPDLDKRIIYRTIKEMIKDLDLFIADDGLIKHYSFYPNTAVKVLERRKQPLPKKIVQAWEDKNHTPYLGRVQK